MTRKQSTACVRFVSTVNQTWYCTHSEPDHIGDVAALTTLGGLECVQDANLLAMRNLPIAFTTKVLLRFGPTQPTGTSRWLL